MTMSPNLMLNLHIRVGVDFNIELEQNLRIYGVELLSFWNSISYYQRIMTEIFDMKRCTCYLQIIYIEAVYLFVESLCDIKRERINQNTVLAKIIEPRHKINVYEKFYFSRKSISPLLYNTI